MTAPTQAPTHARGVIRRRAARPRETTCMDAPEPVTHSLVAYHAQRTPLGCTVTSLSAPLASGLLDHPPIARVTRLPWHGAAWEPWEDVWLARALLVDCFGLDYQRRPDLHRMFAAEVLQVQPWHEWTLPPKLLVSWLVGAHGARIWSRRRAFDEVSRG
jgi:hypothetical protein